MMERRHIGSDPLTQITKRKRYGGSPHKKLEATDDPQMFSCHHLAKKMKGRAVMGEKSSHTEETGIVGGFIYSERCYEDTFDHLKLSNQVGASSSSHSFPSEKNKKRCFSNSKVEIAGVYPPSAFYRPLVEEMKENIFFKSSIKLPDKLPRRVLHNWSLYNLESKLVPLELLLTKHLEMSDRKFFGSGKILDDRVKEFPYHHQLRASSRSSNFLDSDGTPVYLSEIKEWKIHFRFPAFFISIRTNYAWYQLGKPAVQYMPWDEPFTKTTMLGMNILTMLKNESRVSRLSFFDVINRISKFKKDHPSYISSNKAMVGRYILVHGHIILQLLSEYPDKFIKRCAFLNGLSQKMMERQERKPKREVSTSIQEEKGRSSDLGIKPCRKKYMSATMTRLINKIWCEYYSIFLPEDTDEGEETSLNENEEFNDGQDGSEDVHKVSEEVYNLLMLPLNMNILKSVGNNGEANWEGISTGSLLSGERLYRSAIVRGKRIKVGGSVIVEINEPRDVFFVEYMFEKLNGEKMVHGRLMLRGHLTILRDTANEREVFLTNHCLEFELGSVKEIISVDIKSMSWKHEHRKKQYADHILERRRAKVQKKKGLAVELFCKVLYEPERGAFLTLPYGRLGDGTGYCRACNKREASEYFGLDSSKSSFTYKNTIYSIGDFLYVRPQCFRYLNETENMSDGSDMQKTYVVCQLVEIEIASDLTAPTPQTTGIKVKRYYRPDEISSAKSYTSDIREVYHSEDTCTVIVGMVEGKCNVRMKKDFAALKYPAIHDHIFFCNYSYDAAQGSLTELPYNVSLPANSEQALDSLMNDVEKIISIERETTTVEGEEGKLKQWIGASRENRLATFDIFAGCGGLSEGFWQSGVSVTKWAVEYDKMAGEAFCSNHPGAVVFTDNSNVILRAIMEKCGDADDCVSTPEAAELASALSADTIDKLPVPGQVDFISGGPPCQGFSGLNRFNERTWSKIQCEMIAAYLSFADYFRPRFFLLENVRNFVSFNKGQMFRLTVASLLQMGYQVRFGVLEAGAYGIPQARKRLFIWAASPDEVLPEWPEPMHAFVGPELNISLPGGMQFAAVKSTAGGAPFRSITVRDAIGDLPYVPNGASDLSIDYRSSPVSWFQKQIRGKTTVLNDHISKEMGELNLIRCQRIPKHQNANWRSLPNEKVKLSNGEVANLLPSFVLRTAKKNNGWKGVLRRLEWEGHFPTSITDPQPLGQVGKCFHPEQDRIISVRECARSQGFPDSYRFVGNILDKHRQVGNAVPPPLAYALGRKLKEVVDTARY